MKDIINKFKEVRDLVFSLFTILTFIIMFFSEKEFDNTNFLWVKHIIQSLKPEICILLLIILVIRFRRFIGLMFISNNNIEEERLYKEKKIGRLALTTFLLSILLGVFLTLDASINLIKNRVIYWRDHISGSLRKELIHYARFNESNGQLNKAERYYKIVLDEFPFTDDKYVKDKLNVIDKKLDFSELYYNRAAIDEHTLVFTRDQLGLLVTSLKINPEDENVFNLVEVACEHLLSFRPRIEEFYDFIKVNDKEKINRYIDDYSWFLMGNPDIPFYEAKSRNGWSVDKIRSFVKSFTRDEYVEYIYNTWNINNAKEIVKWAAEKKIESQDAPKLEFI